MINRILFDFNLFQKAFEDLMRHQSEAKRKSIGEIRRMESCEGNFEAVKFAFRSVGLIED
jgi:hypothetical protein